MATVNKYTSAHQEPQGPGDARPTALQIVKDEGLEGAYTDKVVLVTGSSSGLGIETVRAMALTGATIFCFARDLGRARDALSSVDGKLEFLACDNSSFKSVRAAAKEFLERSGGKLNIMINNAGVMALPEQTLTEDGFEMQFAANHLGHFLLFQLLKPALLASSTPSLHSRVVNLSSGSHSTSGIHFGNYNLDGEYTEWVGYGQSKTANIYMTNMIERKYGPQGLHGLAVHPGGIWTSLSRHLDPALVKSWEADEALLSTFKSPGQGAATTVYAAVGREYEGTGGKYLEDCGQWGPLPVSPVLNGHGYAEYAFDQANEERLWIDSCQMTGLTGDQA